MRRVAFILLALFAVLVISNVAADGHDAEKNMNSAEETNSVTDQKSYGYGWGGGPGGGGGGWGGWGGYGGGGGGGGWGGWGGGGGGWAGGCKWGSCCVRGYHGGGCRCCYSAQEAIAHMQNQATSP